MVPVFDWSGSTAELTLTSRGTWAINKKAGQKNKEKHIQDLVCVVCFSFHFSSSLGVEYRVAGCPCVESGRRGGKDLTRTCPRGFRTCDSTTTMGPDVEPWNCGNAVSASARQDELKQADGSKAANQPRLFFHLAVRRGEVLYTM